MPLQVKDVYLRPLKGGGYLLKLAWSDGTCSELNQCFQDLIATYNEVSFIFTRVNKLASLLE